jgi:hypothetical protein
MTGDHHSIAKKCKLEKSESGHHTTVVKFAKVGVMEYIASNFPVLDCRTKRN